MSSQLIHTIITLIPSIHKLHGSTLPVCEHMPRELVRPREGLPTAIVGARVGPGTSMSSQLHTIDELIRKPFHSIEMGKHSHASTD